MNKDKLTIIKGYVVLINNEKPLKKSIIIKNGIVIDIKEFDYKIQGEEVNEIINIKDDLIIMGGLINSNIDINHHFANNNESSSSSSFNDAILSSGITTIIDSSTSTTNFENLELKIKSIINKKLNVDFGLIGYITTETSVSEINKMIIEGGVLAFKLSSSLKENDIKNLINEMKKIKIECGNRDVVIMLNEKNQIELVNQMNSNGDIKTCILPSSTTPNNNIKDIILNLPILWTEAKNRNITLSKFSENNSDVPSKLLGLNDKKGSIAIGRDADFVIWNPLEVSKVGCDGKIDDDELFGVIYQTYLRGKLIFNKDEPVQLSEILGKHLIPTKIHTNPIFSNPKLPPIELLNSLEEISFFDCVHLLFEAAPPLANALYEKRPFSSYKQLIDSADSIIKSLELKDKIQVINAHPRIGLNPDQIKKSSSISFREQGLQNENTIDQSILDTYKTLTELNDQYESKFGFKFVVFVNGRSKQEIIPILQQRLSNSFEFELNKGLSEMIEISNSRLLKL